MLLAKLLFLILQSQLKGSGIQWSKSERYYAFSPSLLDSMLAPSLGLYQPDAPAIGFKTQLLGILLFSREKPRHFVAG